MKSRTSILTRIGGSRRFRISSAVVRRYVTWSGVSSLKNAFGGSARSKGGAQVSESATQGRGEQAHALKW